MNGRVEHRRQAYSSGCLSGQRAVLLDEIPKRLQAKAKQQLQRSCRRPRGDRRVQASEQCALSQGGGDAVQRSGANSEALLRLTRQALTADGVPAVLLGETLRRGGLII